MEISKRVKLRFSRVRLHKILAGASGVAAHGAKAGHEGSKELINQRIESA